MWSSAGETFRPDCVSSGGSSLQDRRHRVARRVALERLLAGEQLVEDRAEGEDVRAVVDRQPADLLGRHVAHRAHDRAGLGVAAAGARRRARLLGRSRVDALGQAEVEDLDVAVVRHEDVLGLQVPVDDALAVRGGEALRDLERPVDRLLLRHGRAVELAAQRLALEQLRHGVGDAVVRAEVEDREDVRMRERGDGLGLALEARERVGVRRSSCDGSTLTATSRSSFASRAR